MDLADTGAKAINLYQGISRLVESLQALQKAVTIASTGGPIWADIAILAVEHGPALFEMVQNGIAVLQVAWYKHRLARDRSIVQPIEVREAEGLTRQLWEVVRAVEDAALPLYQVLYTNVLNKPKRLYEADNALVLARDVLVAKLSVIDSYTTLFHSRRPSGPNTSQPQSHRMHTAGKEIGGVSPALLILWVRLMALKQGVADELSVMSRSTQLSGALEQSITPAKGTGGKEKRRGKAIARAELERAKPDGQKLNVSKKEVCSVAVSPNGELLATGCKNNTIVVWYMATGERMHEFRGHAAWVMSITWSADSEEIATAACDNTAMVWNVSTGEQVFPLAKHRDFIEAISWSPDGSLIASATWAGTTGIWDASNGEGIRVLQKHENDVCAVLQEHQHDICAVAWSPDSKKVATGSKDKTCTIWDPPTGNRLMTLKGHNAKVSGVTWSPDGTKIATSSWDCTAAVWDLATGAKEFVFKGHTRIVNAIAWNPDGQMIVTGSYDQTAMLWRVGDSEKVAPSLARVLGGHSGSVNSVAWSDNGKHVVSGSDDGTTRIYSVSVDCVKRSAESFPHLMSWNALA